jgi:hypothetical protein
MEEKDIIEASASVDMMVVENIAQKAQEKVKNLALMLIPICPLTWNFFFYIFLEFRNFGTIGRTQKMFRMEKWTTEKQLEH